MEITVTALLLTYFIHSTVLIGSALLLSRLLGNRHLALQETAIRAAVLGALVTTALQAAGDIHPYAGRVDLLATEATPIAEAASAPPHATRTHAPKPQSAGAPEPAVAPRPASVPPFAFVMSWELGFLGAWLIGAGIGLVRLAMSRRQLTRLLRLSTPLEDGPLVRTARSLARSLHLRRVRFSSSPVITAPFTTGVRKTEVCFPNRALHRLPLSEQQGLCAHELAHAVRRDAAWLALYRGIEAAFFFQPLNARARSRLQELAECLADDRAASFTSNRLALARSLVAVAEWTSAGATPALAVGALSSRSSLARRVERLMGAGTGDGRPTPRSLAVALAALLGLAVFVVPGVAASGGQTDTPAAAPEVAEEEWVVPPVSSLLPIETVLAFLDSPPPPPAPPAPPAPAQEPEAPAPPAPPAPPEDPEDPEDPLAPAIPDGLDEDRLREIEAEMAVVGREIEERMAEHAAEIAELHASSAEIEAALAPHQAELATLSAELAGHALEHARLAQETVGSEAVLASDEELERARTALEANRAELREHMALLQERLAPTQEQLAQLSERAREIAESATPTAGQMARVRELAREMREALRAQQHELRELAREAREAARAARDQERRERTERREREREERQQREERNRQREIENEERRRERQLEREERDRARQLERAERERARELARVERERRDQLREREELERQHLRELKEKEREQLERLREQEQDDQQEAREHQRRGFQLLS